jgi:hypothetical protein
MDATTKIKEDVRQMGRGIGENLTEGLGRAQETVEERIRSGFARTQGLFSSLNDQFGGFVREQPIVALAGAFVVGYVIARAARAFE